MNNVNNFKFFTQGEKATRKHHLIVRDKRVFDVSLPLQAKFSYISNLIEMLIM